MQGLALSPVGLIGGSRTPAPLAIGETVREKFCRRFDRAVSHKRVGHRTWRQVLVNLKYFKLNEHGPVLNVFWSRRSGMGAQEDGEAYKEKTMSILDPALEPDG